MRSQGLGRPDIPRPRSRRSPLRTRTRQGPRASTPRRPIRARAITHIHRSIRGDGGWEENASAIAVSVYAVAGRVPRRAPTAALAAVCFPAWWTIVPIQALSWDGDHLRLSHQSHQGRTLLPAVDRQPEHRSGSTFTKPRSGALFGLRV